MHLKPQVIKADPLGRDILYVHLLSTQAKHDLKEHKKKT